MFVCVLGGGLFVVVLLLLLWGFFCCVGVGVRRESVSRSYSLTPNPFKQLFKNKPKYVTLKITHNVKTELQNIYTYFFPSEQCTAGCI